MSARTYHGTYAYRTDIGKVRKTIEDEAVVLMNSYGNVFMMVCDGMGGGTHGQDAAKMTINEFGKSFKERGKCSARMMDRNWATKIAKSVNKDVYDLGEKYDKATKGIPNAKHGMGSTMVMALIAEDHLLIANIGDSRAYMLKGDELVQLTEDQTYVNYLLHTGKISEQEALTHPDRHVLMNAIGVYPSLSITFSEFAYHGETIILCSDGLYNNLDKDEIRNILSTDMRSDQKAISLVATANHNGGSDNIAVALWESIQND